MTDRYGIETGYAGVTFRSRLEATWAAFFDRIDWRWSYEPFDGDRYLPDFAIHGPSPLLVEVRPVLVEPEYQRQIPTVRVDPHTWAHDLLIVGLDPVMVGGRDHYTWDTHAGLLGEHGTTVTDPDTGDDGLTWEGWAWGTAIWHRCGNCGSPAVHHDEMSYAGRPCGCGRGDNYLGPLDQAELATWWRAAGQQVRWNPNPTSLR